jgi:hypothetical protein
MRPWVPLLVAASAVSFVQPSQAGDAVNILILKEHGVGSAAQAQPFVDKFVAHAQKKIGWASAKGTYHSDRKSAEAFIQSDKPRFGILSLNAYLALKTTQKLETIGQVVASRAGGQQYHLVSKTSGDVSVCKGQKVATDLSEEVRFVDKVASGGAFKLADFKVEATKRPLQGVKMVIRDEVKCALIDDAQFAELAKVDGGKDLKSVWKSAALPPLAVVAFPGATAADKSGFKSALASLCEGDGKAICGEIGVQALKPADESAYAQVLAAYGK